MNSASLEEKSNTQRKKEIMAATGLVLTRESPIHTHKPPHTGQRLKQDTADLAMNHP